MFELFGCPICGEASWSTIGARTYRASDAGHLSSYTRSRFHVLFELWFPGRTEVTLRSRLCRGCGFVSYTPRPDAADMDAKYRYLGVNAMPGPDPDSNIERERARRLFRRVKSMAGLDGELQVLDYGGGDGRLMREFAARGADCSVVDYPAETVSWVTRAGATERDLAAEVHFDLVVCNHVVEHLADPVGVLTALAARLSDGGVIYVEVPMEIWGRAPLHEEPVTHVNFFTPASLQRCLHEAGVGVLSCRLGGYLHPSGRTFPAVVAVGRRGTASKLPPRVPEGAEQTERFLRPGVREKLRRYAAMPSRIPGAVLYKASRLFRSQ